jgi:hypothetical protein
MDSNEFHTPELYTFLEIISQRCEIKPAFAKLFNEMLLQSGMHRRVCRNEGSKCTRHESI